MSAGDNNTTDDQAHLCSAASIAVKIIVKIQYFLLWIPDLPILFFGSVRLRPGPARRVSPCPDFMHIIVIWPSIMRFDLLTQPRKFRDFCQLQIETKSTDNVVVCVCLFLFYQHDNKSHQ